MNRRLHQPPAHPSPPTRSTRGFTLMELLVVIGILALLFAILLPAINMARRHAEITRTSATLASISTALDAYRSDFGDIPRFSRDDPAFPNPLNAAPDRGARLLARALFGPAPANDPRVDHAITPADIATYQNENKMAFQDGHGTPAAPFGHKEHRQIIQRAGEAAAHYPGNIYEPYLDPERFELRKINDVMTAPPDQTRTDNDDLLSADSNFLYGVDTVILDPLNRQAILYYPALAKQPNISDPAASNLVDSYDQNSVQASLYNAFDNPGSGDGAHEGLSLLDPQTDSEHKLLFSLCELLGDTNQNGRIDAGETAATTAPYLLITGGSGGFVSNDTAPNMYWLAREPIANFDLRQTE